MDNICTVKSIGEKKSKMLAKLGIFTVKDMLYHFPRDYEDRSNITLISNANFAENVLIKGIVQMRKKGKYIRGKQTSFRLSVTDESGSLEVVFFNMTYGDRIFFVGDIFIFYGIINDNNGRKQMIHPDFVKVGEGNNSDDFIGIMPIYPLTNGISQKDLRKWNKNCMEYLPIISDVIPSNIVIKNRLCDIHYAIKNIHFPKMQNDINIAKFRLIFEELLLLQTGLLMIKSSLSSNKMAITFRKASNPEEFTKTLPYVLTNAQVRTINELYADMSSVKIMNRLIQGDVGSGKTVVAASAIYKCIKNGYQTALMAPTEILARQHLDTMKGLFKNVVDDVESSIGFLSASLPAKEKKEVLRRLENGEINLLIGTHAVIQESVKFNKLGLVITDEQHRFGVNQRALLSEKGDNPDMIVMTATPIPRTLALILYGDLDISIIDEMPPGRKEILTYSVSESKRKRAYELVLKELMEGSQAYVVTPLIEDSEALSDVVSVGSTFTLLDKFFKKEGFKVALLHGEMKQVEKDRIMREFNEGSIHVLVSTVVIEVGINVPNASIMVIENAERFGLSQMHQLRGRVGRGSRQSYCVLVSRFDSDVAKERAEIMKSTNDGFIIAEKDLSMRGPGEFFGTRQHGVPELKIADLVRHVKILKTVQDEVKELLKNDPTLSLPENKMLREATQEMFEGVGKVGL